MHNQPKIRVNSYGLEGYAVLALLRAQGFMILHPPYEKSEQLF